jgi:endonuclease/exonuclease/phosphatase (EEP) superfamily protein YafD
MTPHPVRRVVARLALSAIAIVAAVELVLIILAPEDGPLGVIQIVAPHLALVGLALIPFSFVDSRRSTLVIAAGFIVVVGIRFGDDWISLPPPTPPASAVQLALVTWNLEGDARPGSATVAFLLAHPADVIGLQELIPETAAAIEADPGMAARYPYHSFLSRDGVLGLGILSRFPISDPESQLEPAIQEVTLDLGAGRLVRILNTHPLHPDIAKAGRRGPPIGFDAAQRNADLDTIRQRIDAHIAAGLPVILLGDLNTAASEPAFDRFVLGLREVHREVGEGPGWTWRPIRLEFLGFGLIRIDHVVTSPDVLSLGIATTCPPIGDHCLVQAGVAVPPRKPG